MKELTGETAILCNMETPLIVQLRINQIKEEFGEHPQCYLVAVMLSTAFNGVIYYDNTHCVTLVGEAFYDKDGVFPIEKVEEGNFIPLIEYGIEHEKALMEGLINKHK